MKKKWFITNCHFGVYIFLVNIVDTFRILGQDPEAVGSVHWQDHQEVCTVPFHVLTVIEKIYGLKMYISKFVFP